MGQDAPLAWGGGMGLAGIDRVASVYELICTNSAGSSSSQTDKLLITIG